MNRIGANPITPNAGFNPAINQANPMLAGAQQRQGDIGDFLGNKQTPDAQMLMKMLQMLIQLLTMLMQQKGGDAGKEAGAAKAGAAKAGGAKAGGGAEKAGGAPKAAAAQGNGKVDGPGGFLWKPASESDGKLVTLLPEKLRGKVAGVEVQSADGRSLAKGRFSGDQKNGGRPHYRFDRGGAAFGNNVKVVATLEDGQKVSWPIANGAARND